MKAYIIVTSMSVMPRDIVLPDPTKAIEYKSFGMAGYIPYVFPVPSVLIDHPDGWILVDTGFGMDEVIMQMNEKTDSPFFILYRDCMNLEKQLASIGLKTSDIKKIVVSHFHPDHSGQLNLFPEADVYVPGAELDDPNHFPIFEDVNFIKIYDDTVIADGIEIIMLPGHTKGHQGLKIDLKNSGSLVFAVDAAYSRKNLSPSIIVSGNAEDPETAHKSIEKLLGYQKNGATIVCGHDDEMYLTYKVFPEYYD